MYIVYTCTFRKCVGFGRTVTMQDTFKPNMLNEHLKTYMYYISLVAYVRKHDTEFILIIPCYKMADGGQMCIKE